MIKAGQTNQKLVALTFDDGPNPLYTAALLDLLQSQRVPATFFVVGRNGEQHPDLLERMIQDCHTVGNHSLSHRFSKYLTQPSFATEITTTQRIIERITGRRPRLFRPPWLFRTPWILRTAEQTGLIAISGTFIHPFEVFQPAAAAMASSAQRRVGPGSILIFHDGYNARGGRRDETVKTVELLIDRLRSDGYQFVTVDRLIGVEAYQSSSTNASA